MRTEWVAQRSKGPIPTQSYYGRQGVVTEEMEYVARLECLSAECMKKVLTSVNRETTDVLTNKR
jgi:phosphomethylpyrimidine synthase